MSDTVIRVEGLGKRYQLGQRDAYGSMRDTVARSFAVPAQRLASMLQRSSPSEEDRGTSQPEYIWALRDVSFEIGRGEIVGVIGRNGAGKSTLLKILSRITYPTEGRVSLRGRIGSLLEVGTGFHPELTGRENIYLNGIILGLSRADVRRKFDEIVHFSEIEEFLDTPVKRYSSGMYVRLAFAVAAHLEPDVLIVDEVLAVGDAAFQQKCLGKMSDVAQGGRTVLFVGHNMNAVQRLCPRSLLFENGELADSGDTGEIVGQYLSSGISSSSPDTWLDMAAAKRTGSGRTQVQALRYSSRHPAVQCYPYAGGPLEVELRISSDAARSISGVAVMIFDRNGVKLVNANSQTLGRVIDVAPGVSSIYVNIRELNLNPGRYVMGWWLASTQKQVLDYSEGALTIDVIDLPGSGLGLRPPGDGLVLCDCTIDVSQFATAEP